MEKKPEKQRPSPRSLFQKTSAATQPDPWLEGIAARKSRMPSADLPKITTAADLVKWRGACPMADTAARLGISLNTLKKYEAAAGALPKYITATCLALDAGLIE